jgi:hypothetical protein
MSSNQYIEKFRKDFANYTKVELLKAKIAFNEGSDGHIAAVQLLAEMEDAATAARHKEAVGVAEKATRISENALAESRESTRLARRAIWVAVFAAGVALLSWLFPRPVVDASKPPIVQQPASVVPSVPANGNHPVTTQSGAP